MNSRIGIVNNVPKDFELELVQPEINHKILIKSLSNNKLELEVNIDRPGLLVINDGYHDDWKANVNNKSALIVRVNHVFKGLFLNSGKNKILLSFEPVYFYIGSFITIFTILFILFYFIFSGVLSSKFSQVKQSVE